MDELLEQYAELNDYELLLIAYLDSEEYTEKAIKTAKSVLKARGLEEPSEEILKKTKEYKETPASEFMTIGSGIHETYKLKRAIKRRDYFFIGKWLIWLAVGFGIYSIFRMNLDNVQSITQRTGFPIWAIYLLEFCFNIAILGLVPFFFFIVYSLRLSKEKRMERKLTFLMPIYYLIIYGISLFILIFFRASKIINPNFP